MDASIDDLFDCFEEQPEPEKAQPADDGPGSGEIADEQLAPT